MTPPQRILFAAAEATPLAKAGGLADVVGALPKALLRRNLDVRVVIPKYRLINEKQFSLRKRPEQFIIHFDGIDHTVRIFEGVLPGSTVPVYLLDHPHYEGAGDVYYQDVTNTADQQVLQVERFLFFSKAVLALPASIGWWPDILHCHDWHAGALPYLARREALLDARYRSIRSLYTIHNLALQGSVSKRRFSELLGPQAAENLPGEALQGPSVNVAALGLLASDAINTVSPTYAKEIRTREYGGGLDEILQARASSLTGILNGIDTERFNPATDSALLRRYSTESLQDKEENTKWLRSHTGLSDAAPIFGMVSRLTEQKGIVLVCDIVERLVQLHVGVVVLGTGDHELEERLTDLARRYPTSCSVTREFDAAYAQSIYAGSDFFLMPSRFEPCGLGQMIALRYGTIPIVRATGGLQDTVTEGPNGVGLVFSSFTADDFLAACKRGLEVFHEKAAWRSLQQRAMAKDFSWLQSAHAYHSLYKRIAEHHA